VGAINMKRKSKSRDVSILVSIILGSLIFIYLGLIISIGYFLNGCFPTLSIVAAIFGLIAYVLLDIIGCTLDDFLEKRRKNKKK
jgi:membrane associated rhomboid family serine protease